MMRRGGGMSYNVLGICEVCGVIAEQIWASVSESHILLLCAANASERSVKIAKQSSYIN